MKVRKNRKGDRLFTLEDIEMLRLIQYLLKEKGFTIEGAKNQLRYHADESTSQLKIIDSLRRLRQFLVDLKNEL
jgi:DNA-binding transcriptional MerR regulator